MLRQDSGEEMKEVFDEMMYRHRWTRNIPPPSTPKRYDPNEPPFNPADILDEADADGLDEE